MKFHPILFSTEMVKAILEGRKTMTRREIKPQPTDHYFQSLVLHATGKYTFAPNGNYNPSNDDILEVKNNFGEVGDVLWVREKWQLKGWDFENGDMNIGFADGSEVECEVYDPTEDSMWLLNQVEQLEKSGVIKVDPNDEERFVYTDKKQPFKPSIHMPKTACRIFLQIKSIRVERLHNISEADAKAEGIKEYKDFHQNTRFLDYMTKTIDGVVSPANSAIDSFQTLWESINGYDSWAANPWVWVIEFEQISKPQNFLQ